MHTMNDQVIRARRLRREHSPELKRELVAHSLVPNASVAAIALEAGINANLLFTWRRAHLAAMGPPVSPSASQAVLVPVKLEASSNDSTSASSLPTAPRTSGTIEIDLAGARIRLRGAVDDASVRCVLQTLHALA
jgi:transposase